jgi:hypothetical protein
METVKLNKPDLGFARSSREDHVEVGPVTPDFSGHPSEQHEELLQLPIVSVVKPSIRYFVSPTLIAVPSFY